MTEMTFDGTVGKTQLAKEMGIYTIEYVHKDIMMGQKFV